MEKAALLTLIFALGMAMPTPGDDLQWQDRGDRFEGLKSVNISGGDFKLLGVHLEPWTVSASASLLHLANPLDEPRELLVKVWEPNRSYQMTPKVRHFEPGTNFSWSRKAVLTPLEISPNQLFLLVTDPRETVYFPARLESPPPKGDSSHHYSFIYRSRAPAQITAEIARQLNGELHPILTLQREEPYPTIARFNWNGYDTNGNTLSSGIYHLRLSVQFTYQQRRVFRVSALGTPPFIADGYPA